MFVETIEAIAAVRSTIEFYDKHFPTFKKIFKLLKDGELNIVIVGAAGTGKTTLGKLFSQQFKRSGPYQESIITEEYGLESNVFGKVIVAPGQKRRQDNWDGLLREITVGKVKLIIHVVSWGYHSFGEFSYTDHRLYRQGMTVEQFVGEYARESQNRELEVLRKIQPHISIAKGKKIVLITLVTKQDLWWNHRKQVKQHYMEGDYDRIIAEISNNEGSRNFIHEYLSASLTMDNFVSGANELLTPTTAGYDERLKFANYKKFINTIESLLKISLNVEEY